MINATKEGRQCADRIGPTGAQWSSIALITAVVTLGLILRPGLTVVVLACIIALGFVVAAAWRFVLVVASLAPPRQVPTPDRWPHYTILAALHDEAAVTPRLISNLSRIDYPQNRLEGFLVLEAHDQATIDIAMAAPKPSWLKIIVVPPGSPQTKPRALNHALSQARGELLTIYDAEDEPDPQQLRQAAARFVADPKLGCLQAPLRIRRLDNAPSSSRFLDRQFAFEYAALFEVTLPGMARLGLPFPLGGTSNHVRTSALRGVGGWDAHNVTEDADLGFRLWSAGWGMGVIDAPTWETPPGALERWLPQRTRWLKGYMQTWGVHTRSPLQLGRRGLVSLLMPLGAAIVSAGAHAPTLAWLASAVLIGLHAGITPATPITGVTVLSLGVIAALMTCAVGARRAGLRYGLTDMLSAPAYWSLLSLAFFHAFWRLIVEPYVWDKTQHDAEPGASDAMEAGREAA